MVFSYDAKVYKGLKYILRKAEEGQDMDRLDRVIADFQRHKMLT